MARSGWIKLCLSFTLLHLITHGLAISYNNTETPVYARVSENVISCEQSGHNPASWSAYPSAAYFERNDRLPTLFTYDMENPNPVTIRACMDLDDPDTDDTSFDDTSAPVDQMIKAPFNSLAGCKRSIADDIELSSRALADPSLHVVPGQVVGVGMTIQSALLRMSSTNSTRSGGGVIVHASWADAVMGIFIGDDFDKAEFARGVLHDFMRGIGENGIGQTLQAQHCGANRNASSVFGIIADTSGSQAFPIIRKAVKAWSEGACAANFDRQPLEPFIPANNETTWHHGNTKTNRTIHKARAVDSSQLSISGECRDQHVASGDGCWSLAKSCGISQSDLSKYNPKPNFCTGLMPDDYVCCSPGSLPFHEPPFPKPVPDAVCGPTKPGTIQPPGSKSAEWNKLNECPLHACCNKWGNCGYGEDFCTAERPGGPKLQNACVNNCGMSIKSGGAPKEFLNIGYFEAWNMKGRKCLNMDVNDIPNGKYSHIHFAFADISADYRPNVDQFKDSFDKFRKAKGFKRILSFGGWAFSTELATYKVFREGTKPANRERLATNLANFITQNDLDGIDFDWEYPGVPDMNWLPHSSPDEGINYAQFLILMRSKLPNKSISFAAPASFWYMKAFDIELMAKIADYIIYMTYDLHGQWDYGNAWSMTNCKKGNCLRSHVDLLETYDALVMITKAGVPSSKVIVGLASYGRQFKMTDPSCTSANCTFTGPDAKGTPGRCTNIPDYIANAEIEEILHKNPHAKAYDHDGSSKYMTYDGNWVSYMDNKDKITRTNLYKGMHFGGVVDWAIDLNSFEFDNKYAGHNTGGLTGDHGPKSGGFGVKKGTGPASKCGEDDSWKEVQCDTPGIAQENMASAARWTDVKADAAWCAGIKHWTSERDDKTATHGFTESIMTYFFKGPPKFVCGALDDSSKNGCVAPDECRASDKKSAASMQLIGQSLHIVNQELDSLRNGLAAAEGHSGSPLTLFSKTFIPKPDNSLDIFLSILQLAIGFGSVGFFNGFLKPLASLGPIKPFDKEGSKIFADDAKDFSNLLINFGLNKVRSDQSSLATKKLTNVTEKINYAYSNTVKEWQNALDNVNTALFSGDDTSISAITNLIQQGNMLDLQPLNASIIQSHAEKFLFSILVPAAWRMQGFYPVLIDTAFPCKTMGIGVGQWTKKKNVGAALICRGSEKSTNAHSNVPVDGRQYQLFAVKDKYYNDRCPPPALRRACALYDCDHYLAELPGIGDILNPEPDLGGISLSQLTDNARDGQDHWHGNHVYSPEEASNPDVMMEMSDILKGDMDISKIPGIVNIPMCTYADIKKNWEKGMTKENQDTYPCNA